MEVGPTCHYIMGGDPRGRRHRGHLRARAVRGGRGGGRHARRQPARRQLAVRPDRVRPARRASHAAEYVKGLKGTVTLDKGAGARRRQRARCRPSGARAARTPTPSTPTSRSACRRSSASSAPRASSGRPSRRSPSSSSGSTRVKVEGGREFNPGWHLALDLQSMLSVSEATTARRHRPQGEPRRAHPRRLPDGRRPPAARSTWSSASAARR